MDKAMHDEIVNKLIDKGKLLEAAFVSFRFVVLPANVSEAEVSNMRLAFMAGAQHVFNSVTAFFDGKPALNDLTVVTLIEKELQVVLREFQEQSKNHLQ